MSKVFWGRNLGFIPHPLQTAADILPVTPFTVHKYCLVQKILIDVQVTFSLWLLKAEFVSKLLSSQSSFQVLSFCHTLRLFVFPSSEMQLLVTACSLHYLALPLQIFPGLCSNWMTYKLLCKLLWGAPTEFVLSMFRDLGIWFELRETRMIYYHSSFFLRD